MKNVLNQRWNLDSLFQGESDSAEFKDFIDQLETAIETFQSKLRAQKSPFTNETSQSFADCIHLYEDLTQRMTEAMAFAECLTAQNIKDEKALALSGRLQKLAARADSCDVLLESQLRDISETDWHSLMENNLKDIAFNLQEKRDLSKKKLPSQEERLISNLSVDGYHAWGNLYYSLVGKIQIPFTRPGEEKAWFSVSQANNLVDDANPSVRKKAFTSLERSWSDNADLFASVLNHISGYRLSVYEARGWSDVLEEPLDYNRMSRKTLDKMWQTINEYKPKFVAFLNRKARLIGKNQLSWYDVDAPLTANSEKLSYEEAGRFVVSHFRSFNPKMADFAESALKNRWIEAENRQNKRPGGFCTSFPLAKQSRIFMTFSGTMGNASTLAHELGHAYHQSVMNQQPYLSQHYAMNVAETASTFSELIVSDAAEAAAKTKEEKLTFLSNKLERSVALLMNIHARYLFETRFYTERKKGIVPVERLNDLMLNAQKEAYVDALDVYHPLFWASKLHFYITDWPFYNFPYTFGFLFSTGIYVQARKEGSAYAAKYDALLRDTGRMTTEQLAEKHLHADLTAPDFWRTALDYCAKDVDEFLRLTDEK
ncbi:MAG: M3 family oligoendopeptidase [Sporolactobacillus sp.]